MKKMDKMMSLGAKQQIIAKKTFPKIPKFSSSFILASNVNSPIFSTLQTLVNQNENPSNIDLLRKILNQIQNMEIYIYFVEFIGIFFKLGIFIFLN